jgi:hypothetical protein
MNVGVVSTLSGSATQGVRLWLEVSGFRDNEALSDVGKSLIAPQRYVPRKRTSESYPLQQFTQAHLERLGRCGHGAQAGLDQTGVNLADES